MITRQPDGSYIINFTTNSVIVDSAAATSKALVCDINGKSVGIELWDVSSSYPNIDLIPPTSDVVIKDALIDEQGPFDEYGAGLVVNLKSTTNESSAYAIKLVKTSSVNQDKLPSLIVKTPTICNGIIISPRYFIINVENQAYGIQLADFTDVYPYTTSVPQSAVKATTEIVANPTQWNGSKGTGSTNLNNKIKTYQDVIRRVKNQLGYPIIEIELCDEQIIEYIDMAIEWYTKYAGYTEEFMVFDSKKYPVGKGYNLNELLQTIYMSYANKDTALSGNYIDYDLFDMRKVINVFSFDQAEFTGTDALFTLEYVYAQQIYYSYMLGSYGFDLITWEALKQFLDTRKRMFSSIPRYIFDPRTQRLRIIPEPDPVNPFIGILGAYVERPIKDIIKERWVQQYTLALSKIALGHIRGKYSNVNLFGGGSIQGGDLTSQGLAERDRLEEEILKSFGEMPPPLMFIG